MERRLAAILAADAVGFSAFMQRNEAACLRTLGTLRDVIESFIAAHRGRVFGRAGDGLIAEFPSAVDAVRAAIDIQQELKARNAPLTDADRLLFRVGIAVGDVSVEGENLLGDGVNIAARLEGAAEPGGICIAASVHEQVRGKVEAQFADLGPLQLKNLARPVHAFKVERAPLAPAGKPGSGSRPTIAVLPFDNMSGDREQDYFADGITEDLITALSKHRSFLVIARNSTVAFKGHGADVRRIGADLGADYVVEGSVRKMGERVRITVQLIEAEGGKHIWADRYDCKLDELFDVQDEITAAISARVEPEVAAAERVRAGKKPADALRAWDCLNLGLAHFFKSTPKDNHEAQRLFRRAIELDQHLAAAHAWLSYAIVLSMVYLDAEPTRQRIEEATATARRAVEIDEKDALTHFAYGRALLAAGAYEDAAGELRTAQDLNPNLAAVHCGLGDSLAYDGRLDEAIPYFERAISLSPYDPQRWAFYSYRALAHLFARQFEQSFQWAQKATRIPNCHWWPFAHRVAALGHLGRPEETRVAVDELVRRRPDFTCGFAARRLFYIKDARQLALYLEGLRKAGISG